MREGGADWRAPVAQSQGPRLDGPRLAWNGDGEGMNMVWPEWGQNPSPEAYWPSPYFADVYAFLGESARPQLHLSRSAEAASPSGSEAAHFTYAVHSSGCWTVSHRAGRRLDRMDEPRAGLG
jgi:hypothetical protein